MDRPKNLVLERHGYDLLACLYDWLCVQCTYS